MGLINGSEFYFVGAPFRCDIIDGSRSVAEGDGLKRACVGENAWFEIDPKGPAIADAEVKITSPSGARVATQNRKTSRGTFRFEYIPQEVGSHKIACKYAGTELNGSPFTCEVYDPLNVRVSELTDGYVGKECTFQVDTSTAGQGDLQVEIESGNRSVKAVMHSLGNGVHEVSFIPKDAGLHAITVSTSLIHRLVLGIFPNIFFDTLISSVSQVHFSN
jgi:filamin